MLLHCTGYHGKIAYFILAFVTNIFFQVIMLLISSQVIVNKEIKSETSIQCAKDRLLTLQPNEKALEVTLKELKPIGGWEPSSKNEVNIMQHYIN